MSAEVCKRCGRSIDYRYGVIVSGYLPRDGWADSSRDPFYCPSADSLTHTPSGAA